MSMTPRDRRCRRCGVPASRDAEPRHHAEEAPRFCGPCGEELGSGGREEYLRLSLLAA